MPKSKGKPAWKSKTLYFNLLTIALGVLEVYTGVYYVDPQLLALINGVGNVVLRFVTSEPVKLA